MTKYNNILETIGNTPHVKINRLFGANHNVWIKLERANPGASIKDRIALAMIEDAEAKGLLAAGGTTGNARIDVDRKTPTHEPLWCRICLDAP